MAKIPALQLDAATRASLRKGGIIFPPNARFMAHTASQDDDGTLHFKTDFAATAKRMVMDSASGGMWSDPSVGHPIQFFNQIDPGVIESIYSPLNALQLLPERKEGDFTTDYVTFVVSEVEGDVTAYSDYTSNFSAGTNFTYPSRQTFRYQTGYTYGNLEVERAAAAKIQLVAERQKAATYIMQVAANRYYLYGVRGMNIHGILNSPDLNPPIAAKTVTMTGGDEELTTWAEKQQDIRGAANHIYNDVWSLWQEIVDNTKGAVNPQTCGLTLAVPPSILPCLDVTNNFNVQVKTLLQQTFPGIKFVTVPELTAEEGNTIMLICDNVPNYGTPGYCVFTEKLRMSPVIANTNSYKQSLSGTTAGAIITRPMLIATMTGV